MQTQALCNKKKKKKKSENNVLETLSICLRKISINKANRMEGKQGLKARQIFDKRIGTVAELHNRVAEDPTYTHTHPPPN